MVQINADIYQRVSEFVDTSRSVLVPRTPGTPPGLVWTSFASRHSASSGRENR